MPRWSPRPPNPAPRDSTRTIAIVALVVGSVALAGQLLSMVAPFLGFSAVGLLGQGFDDGFVEQESGSVSIGGGRVTPEADGTVPAVAVASAVRQASPTPPEA